jgi:hypothetical protein
MLIIKGKMQPPDQLPYWVRLIGALGPVIVSVVSVGLTFALAFLYNEQKKIAEADHKAALDVTDWDWNGDKLEVDVVNHGNGVAERMQLTTLVHADNNAHCEYSLRSNVLKREGIDNPWANAVEADGESKNLKGKRRIGKMAPEILDKKWYGINFHNFIREMKEKGVKELKYCFVIQGVEMSNRQTFTLLREEMMITNPQEYNRSDGLGSVRYTSHDGTFDRFFSRSFINRWSTYLYIRSFAVLSMIPFVGVQPRDLDASGTSRVKRLFLRRRINNTVSSLSESVSNIPKSIVEPLKEIKRSLWLYDDSKKEDIE